MSDYITLWEQDIKPLLIEAYDNQEFSKQRSLLRKALSLQLENTAYFADADSIQQFWDNGTWKDHITLTRNSASGLAANFGKPSVLLAQVIGRHMIEMGLNQDDERFINDMLNATEAMHQHDMCAVGRGDKRVFGCPATWMGNGGWLGRASSFASDILGIHIPEDTSEPKPEPEPTPQADTATSVTMRGILDDMLKVNDLPDVRRIQGMEEEISTMRKDWDATVEELERVRAELKAKPAYADVEVAKTDTMPSGTVSTQKASELFEVPDDHAEMFDIEVPCGTWDGVHPHVPEKDDSYIFDVKTLIPILIAIRSGSIPWLRGHTGTGKTTLIEQVYARLQLPLFRLNLDSDITRGELVGREVLKTDTDGNTVSEFVEGIIPMAMQQPCGLLLDEIDASRPDLGFVLQRLTEGKGFMCLEDGGRTIQPHPYFRMFATANTNGRGDETGLYSGTRALGTAFINRFKPYIEVDYMSQEQEAELLREKAPRLTEQQANEIASYALEHRTAFKNSDVTLACSPRDTIAMAMSWVSYGDAFGTSSNYKQLALEHTILNAADSDDRQVLDGLANRVFAGKGEE